MADHHLLDEIDDKISAKRQCYLKAVWAGHDGEALFWESEVDALLDLRNRVQRGEA